MWMQGEKRMKSLLPGSMMQPGPLPCRSPAVHRAAGRGFLPGCCQQNGPEAAPPWEQCGEREQGKRGRIKQSHRVIKTCNIAGRFHMAGKR